MSPEPRVPPDGLPGAERLLKRSIKKLEAELRRLISTSRMPPSAGRQLLESYALNTQLADAAQRETAQRTFLVNAIVAYRRPEMQLSPLERGSAWNLEALALTMPIKAGSYLGDDRERRRAALDDILSQYEQETFSTEDRELYRRLALASVIKDNADDSAILDSDAPGKTIEVLHEHELCCPSCSANDVEKDVLALQSGNSGGWTSFKCRKCGHHEDGMDGDMPAMRSPWLRTRK